MKIDILTLFPNMYDSFLNESIIKRAIDKKIVKIKTHNIRDYSIDKNKKVDDTPYGGGAGMLLKCQPIFDAVKDLQKANSKIILMTPQGVPFNQRLAYSLSKEEHLIFVCGHYEGFDERIRTLVDMEVSIGDYVLTGGELPSMVITDAVVRLVDGVIEDESHLKDSFTEDLLDYPQYTKPREYNKMKVPEVLTSGHHKNIESWRKEEAVKRTKKRRPDLLDKKYYKVEKKHNFETAKIKEIKGYDLNPKNNAKRDDVISVTKMVIMDLTFAERIAKKNIEKRMQQLLKNVLINNEDSSDDNAFLVLGEIDRIKKMVYNNYMKVLKEEYQEAINKRLDFIVKEFKIEKIEIKKEKEENIEISGKSK